MGLTIITPDTEDFDSTVGQSGRVDVKTPLLNEVVGAQIEAGVTVFQIPDQSEFEGVDGKTHKLTVGMVREWAASDKSNAVLPAGKKFRISGGKGRNIAVALVDEPKGK